MQNIKEAFGGNLRKIRKSKKITIENFSEMLDITPRQLIKIESGETFLTAETLCKISVSLDISLQSLFDFEWQDKSMHYDNNKYIKHHFKAVMLDEIVKLKSLPALKDFNINKTMSIKKLTSFLMEFSKDNNMTIYVDFFVNKARDKIMKISPDGNFSFLVINDEFNDKEIHLKDLNYYEVMEKFREFSIDETKIEYIKTAMDALSNKKALEKLKAMIKGIEISK